MNRVSVLVVVLCAIAILIGVANAQRVSEQPVDSLVGVLRVHPKFHYRYYVDGFGDGQQCALFQADQRLRQIELGSLIRVRGDLASKFFGDPKDKTAALVSTWMIYMDVDQVEVVRRETEPDRSRQENERQNESGERKQGKAKCDPSRGLCCQST